MGKILIDCATRTDNREVDRARAWVSSFPAASYYRFSPQLSQEVALDETSDAILVNMLWETRAYLYANEATAP